MIETPGPDRPDEQFTVVSGNPTPAELAAVAAVLAQAVDEHALDEAKSLVSAPSAWERSQKPVREPLLRGIDSWRGFAG
jgi:uncharacterized protein (DUF1800 family)